MYVFGGLDRTFDTIFTTLIENMISDKVTIDDAKTFLLTHESRIDRRKQMSISPLFTTDLSIKPKNTFDTNEQMFGNNIVTVH